MVKEAGIPTSPDPASLLTLFAQECVMILSCLLAVSILGKLVVALVAVIVLAIMAFVFLGYMAEEKADKRK